MYMTALSVVKVGVEAAPIDAHACGENTRLFQIVPRAWLAVHRQFASMQPLVFCKGSAKAAPPLAGGL